MFMGPRRCIDTYTGYQHYARSRTVTLYLSKQWCEWAGCRVSNRLVATESGARVDECGAIVSSRLTDVVICDCLYFRTILVAI